MILQRRHLIRVFPLFLVVMLCCLSPVLGRSLGAALGRPAAYGQGVLIGVDLVILSTVTFLTLRRAHRRPKRV